MENEELEPFIADGISLGIPNPDATDVEMVDNVFFLDENGELHFRDEYIRSLGLDTVTLRDLTNRMKGVTLKDGKLYFQDSTLPKPVSLEELIGSYTSWQNKLTNGGIFWVGRTSITSAECDNIRVDVKGDPTSGANIEGGRVFVKDVNGNYPSFTTGTKAFSIDQYLLESDSNGLFDDGDFKTLNSSQWRWHDVPNLEIIIPPVDANKSATIIAKVSVRLIKSANPIIFRLIDDTSGVELDRVAIANDATESTEQQVTLTHYGDLVQKVQGLVAINCQCPSSLQQDILQSEPPHTLKVQFYVDDILTDDVITTTQNAAVVDSECILESTDVVKFSGLERRLIGLPNSISDEPIVNSSIDVVLYNVDKTDDVGRKTGTENFVNLTRKQVTFENPFSDANYSISLSSNKNINMWYEAKKPTGFVIMAEKSMTGRVDWTAMKLKFEGDA